MGNGKRSVDRGVKHLGAAQALALVEALPPGLNTRQGAGGTALSGGERQRLTIARAVLKDAPVLVLDETTPATDPTGEAQVQLALELNGPT